MSGRSDGGSDAASPQPDQSPTGGNEPGVGAGGSDAPDPGRAIAGQFDLAGVEVSVGSLELTDQRILAAITAEALREAGATVDDGAPVGAGDAETLYEQLLAGDIDVYWDYLGSPAGLDGVNLGVGATPIELRDQLVELDRANGLTWLEPVGFARGEALAMRAAESARLGVTSIADIGRIAAEEPGAATICFATRAEVGTIETVYSFEFFDQVFVPERGDMYAELAAGTCTFATVPDAIDPAMVENGLVALDDPGGSYLDSTAAPRLRLADAEANPDVAGILTPVARALDGATMAQLVTRVEVGGEDPSDTAHDWLVDEGFVAP